MGPVALSVPFNPYDRVGLRILQSGSTVHLQARVWPRVLNHRLHGCLYTLLSKLGAKFIRNPMIDNLEPVSCEEILSDVVSGAPSTAADVYSGWKILADIPGHADRIGLASRHLNGSAFVRTRARRLCLWAGGQIQRLQTTDLTPENTLPANNAFGALTLLGDGTLVQPYRTPPGKVARFQHSTTIDEAPRVVMSAPQGDFAFGGDVEIAECMIVNWAGRAGLGKQYIGGRGTFTLADFDFDSIWNDTDRTIRRSPPLNNAYRTLFCLVTDSPLDTPTEQSYLAAIDLARRAWEPCFNELTRGQRFVDTTL